MKGGENTISLPGPEIPWPPPVRGKWEREYQAFLRLRSQLMETHNAEGFIGTADSAPDVTCARPEQFR
jgi:hypothetical protein